MSTARRPARTVTALTAAGALALGLSACGSGDTTPSSSPSSSGSASASGSPATAVTTSKIADVKVSGGDEKSAPKIEMETPFGVGEFAVQVLTEGTGAATTDQSIAIIDYALVNGTSGASIDEIYTSNPTGFDVGDSTLISGLRKALTGVKKGSRVIAALPPADAFGPQGNTQIGVAGTDTVVFVFDVRDLATKLGQAEGTALPAKSGHPTVNWTKGTPATFTMPTGKAPTELVIQPLIEGKGAKVEQGDTAVVTYTGALWRNGQVFDSSFKQGPTASFSFPVGGQKVIPGWDKGVEGQRVGSRLLLIVPPSDGYGTAGQGEIKGDDTMVFVVDILAKY
ncbi:MAG: FKBP-type peptidyl-prolyl cis-trans isomerase [Nostocoides sp.]